MPIIHLPAIGTVAAWRAEARWLAAAGVRPEAVIWRLDGEVQENDLFAQSEATPSVAASGMRISREALGVVETALYHSDPERFARAYDIILRLHSGALRWGDRSDPALHRLLQNEKSVRRDIHKMHAFVRFREVGAPDAPRRAFAAWFEPDHPIVEPATPFFAKRFGDMDWIIATPGVTACFEAGALSFLRTEQDFRPPDDATEQLWRTYFAAIFNPARLMVSAMTSEMPRKYWKNLPEASLIPDMIRTAPARACAMQAAAPTVPKPHINRLKPVREVLPDQDGVSLPTLKAALDACRRCPIGACATQGVPGEGPAGARLMIVGEQPGDAEDLAGRPFVGPAGQVFDRCAAAAGLDRRQAYITNAVKHFKFTPQGKRRIHQRPNAGEIDHCRWWLDKERRLVEPRLLLALGATAAQSLTGDGSRLLQRRGHIEQTDDGRAVLITLHPSYILRMPDASNRAEAEVWLISDIRKALDWAAA
jgi:uracil-DNA glycosylase